MPSSHRNRQRGQEVGQCPHCQHRVAEALDGAGVAGGWGAVAREGRAHGNGSGGGGMVGTERRLRWAWSGLSWALEALSSGWSWLALT